MNGIGVLIPQSRILVLGLDSRTTNITDNDFPCLHVPSETAARETAPLSRTYQVNTHS